MKPTNKTIDAKTGHLHSETGPAITWADDSHQHFLRGVWFPKKEWEQIASGATLRQIYALKTYDRRCAAILTYGPEWFLRQANPRTIHKTKKGNELLQRRTPIGTIKVVKYRCPSTNTEHVGWARRDHKNADLAVAERHGISLKDYYDGNVTET